MDAVTAVMLVFSILGAIDRAIGNRFGLGKEFERGFMLLGPLALSMIGMIVLSPLLADILRPALAWVYTATGIDPSMMTSLFFANDLGGSALAREVAADVEVGRFSGMIVSSMMGCTISFTIPFALSAVKREQHHWLLLGMLCGIVAIPLGCLAGGLIHGVPLGVLMLNMLPLFLLSAVLVIGLLRAPQLCAKLFNWLGIALQAMITVGLAMAIIRFLSGREIIPGLNTLEYGASITLNAGIVMSGAFPLLHIVSKLLKKPLAALGRILGVNQTAALGFISTLANSMTTFEAMKDMDSKGVMLTSAFAVSAAFVFGDHLAFTLAFDAAALPAVIAGKLIAGIAGVAVAVLLYPALSAKHRTSEK